MNSIYKFKSLNGKLSSGIISCRRRLGCANVAAVGPANAFQYPTPAYEGDSEQIVQLNSPAELKDVMGTDKYFAETRGNQIIAFAATKKLLAEEKLRRSLHNLNVPFEGIIRENRRWKPSVARPICPVIYEEL